MRHTRPARGRDGRRSPHGASLPPRPCQRLHVVLLCAMAHGAVGRAEQSAAGHAGHAAAGAPVVKPSLERVHTLQGEIIAELAALSSGRPRSSGALEMIGRLGMIYRMQTGVVRNSRTLRAEALQAAATGAKAPGEDATRELAGHQRSTRRDFVEWQAMLAGYAGHEETPEKWRLLCARVADSPAVPHMDEMLDRLDAGLLAQSTTAAELALDELARILQLLQAAAGAPAQLKEERLRALREILADELAIRQRLDAALPDALHWRELRRDQVEVGEKARLLTFDEAGLPPDATTAVREAYSALQAAEAGMLRRNADASRAAADQAIRSLQAAVQAVEAAEAPPAPQDPALALEAAARQPAKFGMMPAMLGFGGEGLDISPMAMLAADIAAVVKLRGRQQKLHDETTGALPAGPVADRRQTAYAAELPQLVRRVEQYLETAAADLGECHAAMLASAERLRAGDSPGSVTHQKAALDRLASAETQLRGFWKELIETLERISKPVEGSPHGAEGEEEAAKEELLMTLVKQIVRVGRIIRELDTLMAETDRWAESSADTIDPERVAQAAAEHRALRDTGLDIVKALIPLGAEAGTLTTAVMEAAQCIDGGADMLDARSYLAARDRQQAAMTFLESAWSYLAMSMSAMTQGETGEQSGEDRQDGEGEYGRSQDVLAAGASAQQDGRPWYWDLPPQAREVIEQSTAATLPPQYEPAITRYYQRLSRGRNAATGGTP